MKKLFLFLLLLNTIPLFSKNIDLENPKYWIDLIKAKEYNTLEENLNKLQKDYENDPTKESKIRSVFYYISDSTEDIEENLKKWIEAKHNSPFGYMALAYYDYNKAWDARGRNFINETPKERIEEFKGILDSVMSNLNTAISKNRKLSVAYSGLILANGSIYGSSETLDEIYKQGIKSNPYSLTIRNTYLNFQLPQWSGGFNSMESSKKIIESVLENSKKFYSKNPDLKLLNGFLEYQKAEAYYLKKEYKKSLNLINKAIKKSKSLIFLGFRASLYLYLKEYDKAISDYKAILKKSPYSKDYLEDLANTYFYHKKSYDLALKTVNKIESYYPNSSVVYRIRGFINYNQKNIDEALLDFLTYLTYKPEDTDVNSYLGIIYFNKKDYESARMYLKVAAKKSKAPSTFYNLAVAQWHLQDCDFVKSSRKYVELCQSNQCDIASVEGIKKNADFAVAKGICKE